MPDTLDPKFIEAADMVLETINETPGNPDSPEVVRSDESTARTEIARGIEAGFTSGKVEGVDEGFQNGHEAGYADGDAAGYQRGYAEGLENATDDEAQRRIAQLEKQLEACRSRYTACKQERDTLAANLTVYTKAAAASYDVWLIQHISRQQQAQAGSTENG